MDLHLVCNSISISTTNMQCLLLQFWHWESNTILEVEWHTNPLTVEESEPFT